MNADKALLQLAKHAGILPSYVDLAGEKKPTARETQLALLRACGWQLDNDAMVVEAAKQSRAKRRERLLPEEIITTSQTVFPLSVPQPGSWSIALEGSQDTVSEGRADETIDLPALPSGVHTLTYRSGNGVEQIRLIAAPKAAPSVFEVTGHERLWGVNLALYGLHSKRNPSLGDYEDLLQATDAFAAHGADFCGINPVHAIGWNSPEVISPYSPSHRGFLNTGHIAVDQITPVSNDSATAIARWREAGVSGQSNKVDHAKHFAHLHPLLRLLFRDFEQSATRAQKTAFDDFCKTGGSRLADFAKHESLSGEHGPDWIRWPPQTTQQKTSSGAAQSNEQSFHIWLQWHAETQLAAAHQHARSSGMKLGLYLDLAVGARRTGAEAWVEQDSIAQGVSIGAPPDHLSPAGQNWDLCAFAPDKLAQSNYQAFRTILARNMRHCGVLRIDHVLGLNRSYWIPDDGSPGGYIKQNFDALLALVRIEAQRNQTVVIGEDLGLIPRGFRKSLAQSGLYSYSVLQYEKTPSGSFRNPARLQRNSLACFGTHDTPTLEGFKKGRDIDWWEKLGWVDSSRVKDVRHTRARECEDLLSMAPQPSRPNSLSTLNHSVTQALASSPVAMVAVQLDDIEQEIEAQNLPGTIDEHPNWRRKTTTLVDDLHDHVSLADTGQLMAEAGRGAPSSDPS